MTRVQPNITRHGLWVKSHPSDPDEVWKKTTVSDKYDVSSYGRVRNSKRGNLLKQVTKPKGYKTAPFLKKHHSVHRLMALAFFGNPKKGQSVDHIDRKPSNNRISNLRWATKYEQANNRGKMSRPSGLHVFCVEVRTEAETEFASISHAAESMTSFSPLSFGSLVRNIRRCVNRGEDYLGRKWFLMDQPVGEIRPIPSAPRYSVSSCGMIKGLYGRWTRGWEFDGYMIVALHKKNRSVHRVVAEAFLGAPSGDDIVVNHKNGVKHWNHLDNLEYCTRSENSQHAIQMGLVGTTKVLRICKDSGMILEQHDSVKDAMSFVGKESGSLIGKCCVGKAVTAYGFRWSYIGESEKFAHLVKPVQKILRICKETGDVLQEHASTKEASSFVGHSGPHSPSIKACCMGRQVSAHGFIWSYIGEESKHKYAKRGKPVLRVCKDTDKVLERYESITAAGLFIGGNNTAIGRCCSENEKYKTAGGYKWIFA